MSDAAPAPAPAPAKKTKASKPKGEKKPRTAPSHPTYGAMIKAAIKEVKDRKGVSKQSILKFITQKYKLGTNEKQINSRLRMALKRGVAAGSLTQTSGTGAAGRFRLPEKAAADDKPKTVSKPKPAGSPRKKTASAGAAKPKKPAAEKPKRAKSPKKPKSPKKASSKPKSARSPKKTASKKTTKKPAAAKKA